MHNFHNWTIQLLSLNVKVCIRFIIFLQISICIFLFVWLEVCALASHLVYFPSKGAVKSLRTGGSWKILGLGVLKILRSKGVTVIYSFIDLFIHSFIYLLFGDIFVGRSVPHYMLFVFREYRTKPVAWNGWNTLKTK